MGTEYFNLMNKNAKVAKFHLESLTGGIEVYKDSKLPIGFENIYSWLEERKKFPCIRNKDKFFIKIGLNSNEALINVTNCVSLSDSFWVKPYWSDLTWEDVSPWTHGYSTVLSTYALEGIFEKAIAEKYYSPVVSTNGSFPHAWKYNEGGSTISFVKAGSKFTLGGFNSGREPYSEYFASVIGRELELDCLHYSIRNHTRADGQIDVVTECTIYTSEDIGSVPAYKLGLTTFEEVIDFASCISFDCLNKVLDMLFLDCLLLNTDRHFGNIEFLVDNKTQKVLSLSPIFDNNMAMLPRFVEELERFNREDFTTSTRESFDDLYRLISKHKNFRDKLIKAKSIVLEKPRRVSMSDSRIKFLNWFLQEQVKWLMSL